MVNNILMLKVSPIRSHVQDLSFRVLIHGLQREQIAGNPASLAQGNDYKMANLPFYRIVLPLPKLMVTPSVIQPVYFCQMGSIAIGQSWSSDQQLAFDISHLSNFDQEQLLTNGDQLWPLIWPSMTKILFRVYPCNTDQTILFSYGFQTFDFRWFSVVDFKLPKSNWNNIRKNLYTTVKKPYISNWKPTFLKRWKYVF